MGALPLSPSELARATDAYMEAGSFAAAARAIDRDESTVRKALRRHAAPERAELFATELAAAHVNALRAVRKARRKAVTALDAADDARDIAMLGHVCHEGLRAITTARAAHARLNDTERAVEQRVREELDATLDRLRSALPADAYARALQALARPDIARGAVESLSDTELDAELDRLTTKHLADRLARIRESLAEQLPTDPTELEREVLPAVSLLVGLASQGDTEARGILGALLSQVRERSP